MQRGFFMSDIIEFFPIIKGLEKIEPVVLAKDFNKSITFEREEFSLRSCPGIRDLTHCGYIIPLWQDLIISYDERQGISVRPSGNMVDQYGESFYDIQFHDEKTLAGYSFGNEYVNFSMKLRCPWYVRTAKGTSLLVTPTFYNENPNFTVASGIITSDCYPMLLAQVILKKFKGEIVLKKGTPLLQLIAIKDQPAIKIHDHDVLVKKKVDILKNWLYSRMHAAGQYRNIGKIFK